MLSRRQARILRCIERSLEENGYPPTIREMMAATGTSSTSVIDYNLERLERLGYIETDQGARALRLVRDVRGARRELRLVTVEESA